MIFVELCKDEMLSWDESNKRQPIFHFSVEPGGVEYWQFEDSNFSPMKKWIKNRETRESGTDETYI